MLIKPASNQIAGSLQIHLAAAFFYLFIVSTSDALVLHVGTTADEGPASLRSALHESQEYFGPDTIRFNLPINDLNHDSVAGTWTIFPQTPLPRLTDDGTVIEANWVGSDKNRTAVQIDGSRLPPGKPLLEIRSSHNRIVAIGWIRCQAYALTITGEQARFNQVVGCAFVGQDGKTDQPTAKSGGILIAEGASDNLIGGTETQQGNTFQALAESAIKIDGSHRNLIQGNRIGSLSNDQIDRCNGWDSASSEQNVGPHHPAVYLLNGSRHNEIGGILTGQGNIISGNMGDGICLQSTNTDSNRIMGNWIGLDCSGRKAAANWQAGIAVRPANPGGEDGPQGTCIGSEAATSRNCLSGNLEYGILLEGPCAGTNILNNWIGVDAEQKNIVTNGLHAIFLHPGLSEEGPSRVKIGPDNLVIADVDDQEANPISALCLSGCRDIEVVGNWLGSTPDGRLATRYNGGLFLKNGAMSNTIGPNNCIQNNKRPGIWMRGESTRQNRITRNILRHNKTAQILLEKGANSNIEPPVLTFIDRQGIHGVATPDAKIELYGANHEECPSYIGDTVADSSGQFSLILKINRFFLQATATDPKGNTSALSAVFIMPVEVINFNGTAGENGQVKLGWQTALENNLFGFYVQRSQDAESWQDQAFVAAKGLSQYGMTYHFIDPTPLEGKSWYRLRQVDLQGNETLSSTIEISQSTPEFIEISTPYPNPFNSEMRLAFTLLQAKYLKLKVLNLAGETVKLLFDGTLEAGQHEVSWNGLDEQNRPVASGVYLIHLTAANQSYMHKIVYSK